MVLKLFKPATKPATESKASAAGPVIAYHSSGRVVWSARDAVSITRCGFQGNPVGFRAVKLISEAAAAVPLLLQSAAQRFDTHPILTLIAQPNPSQGRADLFEAIFGQLMLHGNAYLELVMTSEGGLGELHCLRSDRMAVVPGADGWPVAYDYSVGGRKHRFEKHGDLAPICHLKSFHPLDDHYGLAPIQAAASAIDVHNSASRAVFPNWPCGTALF